MTFKSSLMFAKSLIFPKTEKKSSARRSLFGAMICIGLSIVPLIVVISITNGMIDGMTERLIGLSTSHIQAYVAASIKEVKTPKAFFEYAEGVKEVRGVTNVYPEVGIAGLAIGDDIRTGIQIRAVQNDIFTENKSFKNLFSVLEGELDTFAQTDNTVVIGQKLSDDLGLHAGDTLRIITTKAAQNLIVPKLSSFKISAIVSSGYQEMDQFWVFLPIQTAYKTLSMENANYTIMIETPDAFATNLVRIQRDVRKYFGRYANVYRWDEVHSAEFENFSSTKVMLVFVMMMIVLVASVNISSALIMLVMERQKEIAILKSIGASPKGITLSFLMAGTACATGGLLFGVPVGILLTIFSNQLVKGLENAVNLVTKLVNGSQVKLMDPAYYLSEIPVEIPAVQIILVIVGVLILSVLVSYIPSKKAGKEKPLEILRKN